MDAGEGLGDDAAFAALRDVLAALSATAPRLVFKKTLHRSDVDNNQGRLHVPYDRPPGQKYGVITDANALTAFVTAEEKDIMCDGCYPRRGLQVPAYDRHGRRFDMSLRMARSASCYRLFGGDWRRFVADNQLEEAMEVGLWAFRSVELLPPERRVETSHHPDGALGLAILIRKYV